MAITWNETSDTQWVTHIKDIKVVLTFVGGEWELTCVYFGIERHKTGCISVESAANAALPVMKKEALAVLEAARSTVHAFVREIDSEGENG